MHSRRVATGYWSLRWHLEYCHSNDSGSPQLNWPKPPCRARARLIVVENEHCIHQLPQVPDTIAVLGAGLDLHWLKSPQLTDKEITYWGDMDTWGLLMLARVRLNQPAIKALLMEHALFERYAPNNAVADPTKAQDLAPI